MGQILVDEELRKALREAGYLSGGEHGGKLMCHIPSGVASFTRLKECEEDVSSLAGKFKALLSFFHLDVSPGSEVMPRIPDWVVRKKEKTHS